MFLNKIEQVLRGRNQPLQPDQQFVFHPLFFLHTEMVQLMISFGGFLSILSQNFNLSQYHLGNFWIHTNWNWPLHYWPTNNFNYGNLSLNSHLPNSEEGFTNEVALDFILLLTETNTEKLYKFLPSYMDVIT